MAEFNVFSPRKRNKQNEAYLPSSYNPEERIAYVQVNLSQEEIEEAIRNYIRSSIPLEGNNELPVALVAGRGENGHSASVTISVIPTATQNATVLASNMEGYEDAAHNARRRNGDTDPVEKSSAGKDVCENTSHEEASDEMASDVAEIQEAVKESSEPETKKSSLFDGEESKDSSEPTPEERKAASIFDDV